MSRPGPTAETSERRKLLRRIVVLDRAQQDMKRLWRDGDADALEDAHLLANRMDSLSERLAEAWSEARRRGA